MGKTSDLGVRNLGEKNSQYADKVRFRLKLGWELKSNFISNIVPNDSNRRRVNLSDFDHPLQLVSGDSHQKGCLYWKMKTVDSRRLAWQLCWGNETRLKHRQGILCVVRGNLWRNIKLVSMEKREKCSSWGWGQIQTPNVLQEASQDLRALQPQRQFKTLGGINWMEATGVDVHQEINPAPVVRCPLECFLLKKACGTLLWAVGRCSRTESDEMSSQSAEFLVQRRFQTIRDQTDYPHCSLPYPSAKFGTEEKSSTSASPTKGETTPLGGPWSLALEAALPLSVYGEGGQENSSCRRQVP